MVAVWLLGRPRSARHALIGSCRGGTCPSRGCRWGTLPDDELDVDSVGGRRPTATAACARSKMPSRYAFRYAGRGAERTASRCARSRMALRYRLRSLDSVTAAAGVRRCMRPVEDAIEVLVRAWLAPLDSVRHRVRRRMRPVEDAIEVLVVRLIGTPALSRCRPRGRRSTRARRPRSSRRPPRRSARWPARGCRSAWSGHSRPPSFLRAPWLMPPIASVRRWAGPLVGLGDGPHPLTTTLGTGAPRDIERCPDFTGWRSFISAPLGARRLFIEPQSLTTPGRPR